MSAELLENNTLCDGFTGPARARLARFPISSGWNVEFKVAADIDRLELVRDTPTDQPPCLRVRLRGAASWVRLYQELDARKLPYGRRCRIAIRAAAAEPTDQVEWVAVLSQRAGGKTVFHTRVFERATFEAGGREVRRVVTLGPASEDTRYFFAIQLSGTIRELRLQWCSMTAETAPQRTPLHGRSPDVRIAGRLSVGVVAWDMTHNPVGRAYLLADLHGVRHHVELLGPCFPRYGTSVWAPIRDANITIKTFRPASFRDFVAGAMQLVKENRYDVVHVCKPRLPSLLIGLLYKLYWKVPVLVDIDDRELSFFGAREGLDFDEAARALQAADWEVPYGEIWTRLADRMVDAGDATTVSNPTLADLFGGRVVGHARDERVFDPERYNRTVTRSEFGLRADDRVVLFLGTTRQYKGVLEVAAVLDALQDPGAVLCVIGTIRDAWLREGLARFHRARIVCRDEQPFSRAAELVNMADVVCLLQDPAHPAAAYQVPAKLTDALAMRVPVLTTRVPPLRDMIDAGAVMEVNKETLQPTLRALLSDPALRAEQGLRGRAYYLSELSYAVNGVRLEASLKEARRSPQPPAPWHLSLLRLFQDRLGKPISTMDFLRMTGEARAAKPISRPVARAKLNIAFFWKQNDSGIYGRRSDMVCKYLARHDRIGRIVHFDAPIGLSKLQAQVQVDEDARFKQGNLVVRNTVERFLYLQDDARIIRRAFVYADGGGDVFLGQRLPPLDQFSAFVAETLAHAGAEEHLVAWVCPVNFAYPAVDEHVKFPVMVADVIDNHFAWNLSPALAEKVRMNYAYILGRARVVFANCAPVLREMKKYNGNIHLVPNGAEIFPAGRRWPKPEVLNAIPRPILGYVGNLSDRLRFCLLERMAAEHPEWSLVFIGSAHLNTDVLVLRRYPNCHFLGVVPYEQATACIAHFDVALIPHEVNAMTESMNPLKLYVYASVGVPIVSTAIPNIGDLRSAVRVARSDDAFIAAVARTLKIRARRQRPTARLRAVSWTVRVETMLKQLDRCL